MKFRPSFFLQQIKNQPNLKKIVFNIYWLLLDRLIRISFGVFIGVWLARYLGPEQFGLFSFATALIGLITPLSNLGLQDIVVRNLTHNPSSKYQIIGTALLLQLIGGFLAYCFSIAIIIFLRPDDQLAIWLVAVLGSVMLFKFSEVSIYWFESQVESRYVLWVQGSTFLVFVFIKSALILTDMPLIAFAWASMLEILIAAILMMVMLDLRGLNLRFFRISLAWIKNLLAESWPLLLSGFAIMIYVRIDQIMLGEMVGDHAVGVYSAALRLSEVWYFIPTVVVASVFPSILKLKNLSKANYDKRQQQLYDLMVWISVGIAVPMTFLSSTIVVILFGEAYASAGDILAIHIWTSVFVFLGVASGKFLIAGNRQILCLQRTLLGAALNIALNYLLIPHYGAVGAAFATLIANIIAAYFFDLFSPTTREMFTMKTRAFNLIRPFLK